MAIDDFQMVEAWQRVLRLSNLEPGQAVTLLTGPASHAQTLRTADVAARSMGAIVSRLELAPVNGEKSLSRDPLAYLGSTPLTGNRAALAALKASDLVLDLMLLLFSPEQQELLDHGVKILLAIEPPEVLCRLEPSLQDRQRVIAAAAYLEQAHSMRVTSAAGTDFSCNLGQYPVIKEYGFVDTPGRWDHWPSGFPLTWSTEGTARGKIVLGIGDILLPMKSYIQSEIELTFVNGYVQAIQGGLDAELLKDYIEAFADPEGFALSHVGWGVQERARWSVLGLYDREQTIGMDARAFAGNFLFSLGPNTEVGGLRNTACHIDIPMRHCTIALDERIVVDKGRLLGHPPS